MSATPPTLDELLEGPLATSTSESTAGSTSFVFVEESGRRARRVRSVGIAATLACLTYVGVVVSSFAGVQLPLGPLPRPTGPTAAPPAARVVASPPTPAAGNPLPAGTAGSLPGDIDGNNDGGPPLQAAGVVAGEQQPSTGVAGGRTAGPAAVLPVDRAPGRASRSVRTGAGASQASATSSRATRSSGVRPAPSSTAPSTAPSSSPSRPPQAAADPTPGSKATVAPRRPSAVPGNGKGVSRRPTSTPSTPPRR